MHGICSHFELNLVVVSQRPSGLLIGQPQMDLHHQHPQPLQSYQSPCPLMRQPLQHSMSACCSSAPRPACRPVPAVAELSDLMPWPNIPRAAKAPANDNLCSCTPMHALTAITRGVAIAGLSTACACSAHLQAIHIDASGMAEIRKVMKTPVGICLDVNSSRQQLNASDKPSASKAILTDPASIPRER